MPAFRFHAPLLLLLPLLAACEDAPTAPTSYAQEVGGATWVAVAEPAGMATAEGWLPLLGPAAAGEVRALRSAAARARRGGSIDEALSLEDSALLLAAARAERVEAPERVTAPLAALDAWRARAAGRLAVGAHPALARAAARVEAEAADARAALAAGDTLAALAPLARATLAAREHAPVAVGARLLAALEARLAVPARGPAAERARRLLSGAREGLATDDTVRALRRAVYAHQLLDAAGRGRMVDTAGSRH